MFRHRGDPHVQLLDLARQLVDQVQVPPEHKPVVVAHQPGDDFGQLPALAAQTTTCHLGQDLRIVLSRNHGLQDRPACHPMMFDTTEPSLTFANSRIFATRLTCELRS